MTPSAFETDYHLAVSPRRFLEQVTWISTQFNVVSPDALNPGAGPLPNNAAMITFDDGWLGTFEHGLPVLDSLRLPSLTFLNMEPIIHREPMSSAVGCYLEKQEPDILEKIGVKRPAHLHLTPELMEAAVDASTPGLRNRVLEYQGALADEDTLKRWDKSDLVRFGNHLFNHWNPVAIDMARMSQQMARNEDSLASYANTIRMLAFPNGLYGTCFDERHIELARTSGTSKVFSAMPMVNDTPSAFMLHRLCMTNVHDSPADIWAALYS